MEIPGYRFVPARKKPGGFLLACEGVGRDPHRSLPPSHRKSASLGLSAGKRLRVSHRLRRHNRSSSKGVFLIVIMTYFADRSAEE